MENGTARPTDKERIERTEHEIGGKKYVVTRHFVGGDDLERVIFSLAESRAGRESGLRAK